MFQGVHFCKKDMPLLYCIPVRLKNEGVARILCAIIIPSILKRSELVEKQPQTMTEPPMGLTNTFTSLLTSSIHTDNNIMFLFPMFNVCQGHGFQIHSSTAFFFF